MRTRRLPVSVGHRSAAAKWLDEDERIRFGAIAEALVTNAENTGSAALEETDHGSFPQSHFLKAVSNIGTGVDIDHARPFVFAQAIEGNKLGTGEFSGHVSSSN